jgi:hypothetical protein
MESSLLAKISALVKRRQKTERRAVKRHAPGQRTVCLIRTGDDAPPVTAAVHNLAAKGAGLLAGRDYPPGTILRILLVNGSHTCAVALEMKVARCNPTSGGQWFVGGPFVQPLRHEDLLPFMM